MSAYKVVFRDDLEKGNGSSLQWEVGNPVMFVAVQVSRESGTSNAFLQTKIINVSNAVVSSFDIQATVQADGETRHYSETVLDCDIAPGESYAPKAIAINATSVESVAVSAENVSESGIKKQYSKRYLSLPLSKKQRELSEKAAEELSLLLREERCSCKSAHLFEIEEHEGWWQCACGLPNVGGDRCLHCSLERRSPAALASEAQLEEWADQRRERNRVAAEKRATEKARTKRLAMRAAVVASVIAGLCVVLGSAQYVVNSVLGLEETKAELESISDGQIGYRVAFGTSHGKHLNWQIVAREDGRTLLLATEHVTSMPFSDDSAAGEAASSWESSPVRTWLNDSFSDSFSFFEKRSIASSNGDLATCLSIDEIADYLPGYSIRANSEAWLTRTRSALEADKVLAINEVGEIVRVSGTEYMPVRPAIWVNAAASDEESATDDVTVVCSEASSGEPLKITTQKKTSAAASEEINPPEIPGYAYSGDADSATVQFGVDKRVDFKYAKAATYTVSYECEGKSIKKTVTRSAVPGETATETAPSIPGYSLVSEKKRTFVVGSDEETSIVFEYRKKTASSGGSPSYAGSSSGGSNGSTGYHDEYSADDFFIK